MERIGVYGTLKRGQSAESKMTGARFVKEIPIAGRWTIMACFSNRSGKYHPFIMPSFKKQYIIFQIFESESFASIDKYEGVGTGLFYKRKIKLAPNDFIYIYSPTIKTILRRLYQRFKSGNDAGRCVVKTRYNKRPCLSFNG